MINEKDRARFLEEADPIRKAKALPKYGEQQLILMREELRKERFTECLALLEQYRDAVKTSFTKLKATGRDAERKPDGFRQMQIHLRQSVHHLGPIVQAVPFELRRPFEDIRRELEAIDRELLTMLFPPKTGAPCAVRSHAAPSASRSCSTPRA